MGMTRKDIEALLDKKNKDIKLRDYQQECIDAIMSQPPGTSMLVEMATGLGKTATFTNLPKAKNEKVLILSMSKELVLNPISYYNEPVAIEMESFHREGTDENIVTASVQSIVNRLDKYDPNEFDYVIVDEAHHAPARTFRKVIDYFHPKKYLIGFTATPKRFDGVRLDDIFSKIVFRRDLIWGIKNKMLCDIYSRKITIDVDLTKVKINQNKKGEMDFNENDLAKAMVNSAPAIADIYHKYAFGPTLIAVSRISLAEDVARLIDGAYAISQKTSPEERAKLLAQFREGKIACLVSVDILREGVDLPCTATVIMARPTLSSTVYIQIVGRGLRLYPGKQFLNLIDIDGILGPNVTLCSAATLAGIDLSAVSKKDRERLDGVMVSEMEELSKELGDNPANWITNAEAVEAWADHSGYDTHNVNWHLMPDGSMELWFEDWDTKKKYLAEIPSPDALGRTIFGYTRMPVQIALDLYEEILKNQHKPSRKLWDKGEIAKWADKEITEPQIKKIKFLMPEFDCTGLTKFQASCIITRMESKKDENKEKTERIYPVDPHSAPEHYRSYEEVKVRRSTAVLYDYDPGPEYLMTVSERRLIKDYKAWIERCVRIAIKRTNGDPNALVNLLNNTKRAVYAQLFFKNYPQYRYLCNINGKNQSRKNIYQMLSQLADKMIPEAVNDYFVNPQNREEGNKKIKPDLTAFPLNAIQFEFPESRGRVGKSNSKHLQSKQEKKAKEMEQWAKREKAKANKKKQGR